MTVGSEHEVYQRPPGVLRSALVDAVKVIGGAFRLLWRHWPVLVVLYLAGVVAHELLMRGAVKVSAFNAVLGFLVLLLAPLATLTAFVLMLRVLRPSLPALSRLAARAPVESGRRGPGLLGHLGSVLVPFLTVYAAYGYLKEDVSEYMYRVWEDDTINNPEFLSNPDSMDAMSRLPFSLGVGLVSVVVIAVALRWIVDRWSIVDRHPWLGLPAAYVEIVWISLGVVVIVDLSTTSRGWLENRRVVQWAYDVWYDVSGVFGGVADPVRDGASWLWGTISSSATAVVVVPVAWLVVGAVVYGHRLTPQGSISDQILAASHRRFPRMPELAHRVVASVGGQVAERFRDLWHGLRLLVRAGLVPMLLFCLAFVIAGGVTEYLWELERLLIGPQDLGTVWIPFSGPLSTFNNTVGWSLLACLLAAAIDRVLRVQASEPEAAPDAPQVPASRPGPPAEASEPSVDVDSDRFPTASYPEVVSRT